jgi:predicted nucleic acid-binding protein
MAGLITMPDKNILIDSDVLIDFIHAVDQAKSTLQDLEKDYTFNVSVITRFELLVGCKNKTEVRTLLNFLMKFELLHLNTAISEESVNLFDKYRLSHGVLIPDTIIAATAITYEIPLLTKNQKDFRFIENLNLLSYK